MKSSRLSMSLLFVGVISAFNPVFAQERLTPITTASRAVSQSVPDPAAQIRDLARVLRANDLAALVRAVVPPSHYQLMRQSFELQRLKPITPAERSKFSEGIAKLTDANAVDKFMLEIEPKLIEARPKAAGALLIGMGALQVALASDDSKLTPEQRVALESALPGIQKWASETDFLSSVSMRQALSLLADAARNTGVRSIDELKMLSFEQALAKAGALLAASKQALTIYGLDVNAIADSLQVQVLSQEGETARVRTTITLFDAPISSDLDLVLLEGRWYSKNTVAKLNMHSKELAAN